MLRSVLGLPRSYWKVLDENMNLARYLELPLMSNTLAKNIDALFENPQPHLIETSNTLEVNITWSDAADAHYQPEPQEDGSYHLWLSGRSAKVRLSQYDHNIVLPGNIQRLVHPLSHEPDVQMERDTLALAASEISSWNQLALELVQTNKNVLEKLKEKLDTLSATKVTNPDSQVSGPPKHAVIPVQHATSPKGGRGNFATNGQPWDHDDKIRLPGWFEPRRHLPKKQIELEFKRDFDHRRKYSGIYAIWYQQEGKKRKKALRHKGNPSNPCAAKRCQLTVASDCNRTSLGSTSSNSSQSAGAPQPDDMCPTPSKSVTEESMATRKECQSRRSEKAISSGQPNRTASRAQFRYSDVGNMQFVGSNEAMDPHQQRSPSFLGHILN
ncbi:hypothetical protein VN97_g12809 [Penicillium thymicola]|uniref:Uncharacterized protein n=1 Tax=Penicillium thymicola TaxID=293382 RepID=A0AAI9T4T0_PENTH|nr:hypothetical protein VN97_g12809 [Penicillium thymicola]